MPHLLIIGGSDAGISAALRARELEPAFEATVVIADAFANYSICGLPFLLSGEVTDWRHLAHRQTKEIEGLGIRLVLSHTAESIDIERQRVRATNAAGTTVDLSYDKLVIATGATPVQPRVKGVAEPGVFFLRTMGDGLAVHEYLARKTVSSAVIVGGGYIGVEMADALTRRGIAVTLIEHGKQPLKTVDPEFGSAVAQELQRNGVTVVTGGDVQLISPCLHGLLVSGDGLPAGLHSQLVLIATGARPVTALATTAGAELGQGGAIRVNRRMETNLPNVYGAGDCVETWHAMLNRSVYLPLGTTAHKQGRVAAENAIGRESNIAGTLGTQVVKVFDLAIARTGLNDAEAAAAGYAPISIATTANDHKSYYPHHRPLRLRVTGDRFTGQLLGAQILGDYRGEVAKRIDVFASALFNRMSVTSLNDLDLSYTPPLGMPWDAVQVAAQEWEDHVRRTRI